MTNEWYYVIKVSKSNVIGRTSSLGAAIVMKSRAQDKRKGKFVIFKRE